MLPRLKNEARKLNGQIVSMANSSDPYPNLDEETGLTRKCLEVLSGQNCKVQIITKSDLVVRDADLLMKMRSMVSVTVTTDNDDTAKLIEPHAPLSSDRLEAVKTLIEKGIPVSVRVDPIIPFLNDKPESLMKTVASIGVRHVTASTCKIKSDSWKRLSTALPEIARKLEPLYFERGERTAGYTYLPLNLRIDLLKTVKDLAGKYNLQFGTCREGLAQLNTATCDGSWLLS